MGSGAEAVGDENSIVIGLDGLVPLSDSYKLLSDGANQVESNLDFLLGLVGLHNSADNGDVCVLFADAVDCGHHHDVNIYNKINLYHCFSWPVSEE